MVKEAKCTMRQEQKTKAVTLLALFVLLIGFLLVFDMAKGEPTGASVQYLSNSTKNATPPDVRQDAKGTITVVSLTTTQQNTKWKAYVGNVTGTLVLRDADDYATYQWPGGGSPDGEVYITRNSTIDWDSIQCANATDVETEQAALGHSPTAIDNINNTFNNKVHEAIPIGDVTIPASQCKSTATWVNNTAQTLTESSFFQEVLLMDQYARIVYAALIDQDADSYRNENTTYDFQAIVPDYVGAPIAIYYFYVEISG
jgi:hypothetical protein